MHSHLSETCTSPPTHDEDYGAGRSPKGIPKYAVHYARNHPAARDHRTRPCAHRPSAPKLRQPLHALIITMQVTPYQEDLVSGWLKFTSRFKRRAAIATSAAGRCDASCA
mmetsp:Transcript_40277/g.91194  ORF Transcript_40277/g.91194 Transcript_40277/m.91194 type:complete len:110 (-) Transcript_40277:288-617(-)